MDQEDITKNALIFLKDMEGIVERHEDIIGQPALYQFMLETIFTMAGNDLEEYVDKKKVLKELSNAALKAAFIK